MNEHRPLELLIPWYVNGTLHESEQDRLNRHLGACPSCREQVQREIEFSRALCETPAAMAQANRASARAELLARVAHDSGKQGPRFHIRALAAASIIAVAVLLIGIFDTKPAYRTLTVPAQGDQTVVQILFEPAIGEREIRDSLDQLSGADVLGSPAAGLYRLSVDDPSRAEDIAEHARQLPGVRWADLER